MKRKREVETKYRKPHGPGGPQPRPGHRPEEKKKIEPKVFYKFHDSDDEDDDTY